MIRISLGRFALTFDFPRWVFVALIGSVLYAATTPNRFTDGEVLSAAKLNENFDTITNKISDLEMKLEKRLGLYCGKTAATYDGATVGGYSGAKTKCEIACGNTNAHMCTAHEMIHSLQGGASIPFNVWYAWGGTSPGAVADCRAFTSVIGTDQGFIWSSTQFTTTTCPNNYAIACCL